jgi:transposase-like protein
MPKCQAKVQNTMTVAQKRATTSQISSDKHFRVSHGNNEFVGGCRHVNGIESFWSYAKHRLAQFYGVRADKFELHLKETEFGLNHRHDDLYKALLQLLRPHPL